MSNNKFHINSSLKPLVVLMILTITMVVTGCGDDAFTSPEGSTTPANNTTPGSGTPAPTPTSPAPSQAPANGPPAHTITLTYPQSSAIENLGGGVYRREGKALVRDVNGHVVADGTIVYLSILDSVIAQGIIGTNDTIQDNAITDLDLLDGGGNPSLFTNAYVQRNSAIRYIQPGDHIFLTFADEEDKSRVVGGIQDTQISVTQPYSRVYPDAVDYPAPDPSIDPSDPNYKDPVGYLIGASLLGAEISGTDLSGNLVSGYAVTQGGIATFYVTYPATVETIGSGCGISAIDTRARPTGSAQVYLVASVSSAVTTIDDRFCFTSIAGGTLYAVPENLTSSGDVTVTYEDGGDTVLLPFARLNVSVSDANGSNITINNGTDKSVDIRTNDRGRATFTVQINVPPASGNATVTITSLLDPDVEPITVTVSSNTPVVP